MKTLALDLNSGRLSRWVGDPVGVAEYTDKYGDAYILKVSVHDGSGAPVSDCQVQFLVKKSGRRDLIPVWSQVGFSRQASTSSRSCETYTAPVSVQCSAYSSALRVDSAPGNDIPEASFLGVLRVVSGDKVAEAEFEYVIKNSAFRARDI